MSSLVAFKLSEFLNKYKMNPPREGESMTYMGQHVGRVIGVDPDPNVDKFYVAVLGDISFCQDLKNIGIGEVVKIPYVDPETVEDEYLKKLYEARNIYSMSHQPAPKPEPPKAKFILSG